MKKVKKPVFKIGDYIKIVNPVFFIRCGYPLGIQEGIDQLITEDEKEIIKKLFEHRECKTDDWLFKPSDTRKDKNYIKMLEILSYERISRRLFGGNQRTIHTTEIKELKDQRLIVVDKKIVKTGTRYSYYDPEDGGYSTLINTKSHIILELYTSGITVDYPTTNSGRLFIESINIEHTEHNSDELGMIP